MPRARDLFAMKRRARCCTLLATGLNLAFHRCSVFCALVDVSSTALIHKCLPSMAFRAPVFILAARRQVSSRGRRHASFAACNTPRDVSQTDNSLAGCAARGSSTLCEALANSEAAIATSAQQRELNLRVAEAPEALVTSGVASRQAVRHQSASKGRSAAAAFWHRKSAAAAHPLALWPADARR